MPVLSDATIEEILGTEALDVEPFDAENLTPNGLDLSVGETMLPRTDETVQEGTATIPPRERFFVSTEEVVTLGPGLAGQLWIRSTYARKGIIASFGKVEAGFSGTLTIACFNAARDPIELPVGERFCQIAFEALTQDAEALYEERSGTYQGQRGVTLARE